MNFLCDVHISLKISKKLEKLGHRSLHVNHILSKWNTSDEEITKYADKNNLILITKDQDFRNGFLLHSKPKKLIKVNLGNISNRELMKILENLLKTVQFIEISHKSFMIEISESSFTIITND